MEPYVLRFTFYVFAILRFGFDLLGRVYILVSGECSRLPWLPAFPRDLRSCDRRTRSVCMPPRQARVAFA